MKFRKQNEKNIRIKKALQHQPSISNVQESDEMTCISSMMPASGSNFFSNLKQNQTIFEKMNKFKNETKFITKMPPQNYLQNCEEFPIIKPQSKSIKEKINLSSIEDLVLSSKIKKEKKINSILPIRNLLIKEYSYDHSECTEKIVDFTLSSFNFPDTEEIAIEEDRFWKDERKDPIIDKLFGDYEDERGPEKKNSDEFSTMEEAMEPPRSKLVQRRNRLTSILKLSPAADLKKNEGQRKVSFNGRISIKLISRNKRKSCYFD